AGLQDQIGVDGHDEGNAGDGHRRFVNGRQLDVGNIHASGVSGAAAPCEVDVQLAVQPVGVVAEVIERTLPYVHVGGAEKVLQKALGVDVHNQAVEFFVHREKHVQAIGTRRGVDFVIPAVEFAGEVDGGARGFDRSLRVQARDGGAEEGLVPPGRLV